MFQIIKKDQQENIYQFSGCHQNLSEFCTLRCPQGLGPYQQLFLTQGDFHTSIAQMTFPLLLGLENKVTFRHTPTVSVKV